MAPGGPFDAEKAVPPEVLKSLNERYNLDAPVIVQYKDYMLNLLQGDFGPSFRYPSRSVTEMIFTGMPVTFELVFLCNSSCFNYWYICRCFSCSQKKYCAGLHTNDNRYDWNMSCQLFLLGPLLVLFFGIHLELLPVSGWDTLPGDKILPSITLGAAYAAYIARLSRGGMLETLNQDYVEDSTGQKGLSEFQCSI